MSRGMLTLVIAISVINIISALYSKQCIIKMRDMLDEANPNLNMAEESNE